MTKKKPSAALIVANSTKPPPKPKEVLQALLARERVRLEAIVEERTAARQKATKEVEAAEKVYALALILPEIDGPMEHAYGPRKTPVLHNNGWRRERIRAKHYVSIVYGHGENSATLNTKPELLADTVAGRALAVALTVEADADEAWRACRISSDKGTLEPDERWVRSQLANFRAKAEGALPTSPVDPAQRVVRMLSDPKTVAALDTIRDRINGAKTPSAAPLLSASA